MPLTGDDKRVQDSFKREYGKERGKRIFYASINSGRVKNIPEARRMKRNRRKSR
jgi:hypothetical protein